MMKPGDSPEPSADGSVSVPLFNFGPGWLHDVFDVSVVFNTDKRSNPLSEDESDSIELFLNTTPISGYITITSPPGRTIWQGGVSARLESVATYYESMRPKQLVDRVLNLGEASYISGSVTFPFEFDTSTFPMYDSYEGENFGVRHGILITILRPWYTFDVVTFAPFALQTVLSEHEFFSWMDSEGRTVSSPAPPLSPVPPKEPIPPTRSGDGADASDFPAPPSTPPAIPDELSSTSPPSLSSPGDSTVAASVSATTATNAVAVTGAGVGVDASVGAAGVAGRRAEAPALAPISVAPSPAVGSGTPAGVAASPWSQRVPDVGHGKDGDEVGSGAGAGSGAGVSEAVADEVDEAHAVIINDCHGLCIFDFRQPGYSLTSTLEGEVRFYNLAKPIVRVELMLLKIEGSDDGAVETTPFHEVLMDSREAGNENLPFVGEGALSVQLDLSQVSLTPGFTVEKEKKSSDGKLDDDSDMEEVEEDELLYVRHYIRVVVYSSVEPEEKYWNTQEIALFRALPSAVSMIPGTPSRSAETTAAHTPTKNRPSHQLSGPRLDPALHLGGSISARDSKAFESPARTLAQATIAETDSPV